MITKKPLNIESKEYLKLQRRSYWGANIADKKFLAGKGKTKQNKKLQQNL